MTAPLASSPDSGSPPGPASPAGGSHLRLLQEGRIEVLGLLPYASNYTFLTTVQWRDETVRAVYKPTRGERPLWDFPHGSLATREVAAYALSERAGWGMVPPTVLRGDGPMGPGSLQLFVDHDPERHYFVLADERPRDFDVFAVFDIVANNADRKAGHVIVDRSSHLWGVDHGLCFHAQPKLRTVIWKYAGDELSEALRRDLEALHESMKGETHREHEGPGPPRLESLLRREEMAAMQRRIEGLLEAGRFPEPAGARPVPWPLI